MKMQNKWNCTIIALAFTMVLGTVDIHAVCVPCQDVVDDALNRACHEFAASPPTSEAAMATAALDIFNDILSTAELCDDGQSVGGSAAACQDDLFRLLGVSLPVPEKVPEVILGFTFVETNQEGYPEYRHDSTDIRFVRLPGGSFDMGSPAEEPGHYPDEGPVHTVTLSPFLIAKYEVTQAKYETVMTGNTAGLEASPSSDKGDKLPVVRVSWDDLYLEDGFLERTGLVLPSEAQWEYACRAGTSGAYAGNGVLDDMGWFLDNSGGTSHEVGGKRPNQFGLHDMYGNVLEWCEDVYRERFYDEVQDGLDPVSKSGQDVSPYELRVIRGGAFDVVAQGCRSSSRFSDLRSPSLRRGVIGFRPARPLPVIEPEPEPPHDDDDGVLDSDDDNDGVLDSDDDNDGVLGSDDDNDGVLDSDDDNDGVFDIGDWEVSDLDDLIDLGDLESKDLGDLDLGDFNITDPIDLGDLDLGDLDLGDFNSTDPIDLGDLEFDEIYYYDLSGVYWGHLDLLDPDTPIINSD